MSGRGREAAGARGRRLAAALAGGAVLVLGGCAQVPKESVDLSVTLGRDLAETHRANRVLAVQYFARMKRDVNQFVDERYRPFVIQRSMERFRLLERLAPAAEPGADPARIRRAFDELVVYVEEVAAEIEDYRAGLLRDIEAKEGAVVTAIDDSYARMQAAQAALTAHLMSARKVEEAQADLLRRAGVLELREGVVDRLVDLSDRIAGLVERARRGAPGELQAAADALAQIVHGEGAPAASGSGPSP